jgi:hypothetical protein
MTEPTKNTSKTDWRQKEIDQVTREYIAYGDLAARRFREENFDRLRRESKRLERQQERDEK